MSSNPSSPVGCNSDGSKPAGRTILSLFLRSKYSSSVKASSAFGIGPTNPISFISTWVTRPVLLSTRTPSHSLSGASESQPLSAKKTSLPLICSRWMADTPRLPSSSLSQLDFPLPFPTASPPPIPTSTSASANASPAAPAPPNFWPSSSTAFRTRPYTACPGNPSRAVSMFACTTCSSQMWLVVSPTIVTLTIKSLHPPPDGTVQNRSFKRTMLITPSASSSSSISSTASTPSMVLTSIMARTTSEVKAAVPA